MKRPNLNSIIDAVAFVGFVTLTTTGVLMRYLLPPGSGRHSTIWSLDRHEWGDIHFWISVGFFSLLALHLLLHWRWIVSAVSRQHHEVSGFRAGLGIVGLITVVALVLSLLLTPVERDPAGNGASPPSSYKYEESSIRGSMTLKMVEETIGVPAVYMIESLKLPGSTPVDRPLSLLKREYHFEIDEIREAVREYNIQK